MTGDFGRLAARWGWRSRAGLGHRRLPRAAIGCEAMETRALMTSGSLASLLPAPQAAGSVTVIAGTTPGQGASQAVVLTTTTAGSNAKLVSALQQFLNDLESAIQTPSTSANRALQADLRQIAALAGTGDARAVQRLNTDVTTIVASGSITAPQRLALISDLESVVLGAGVPGSVVVTAANLALAPPHASTPGLGTESSSDLADPNALGTPQAGSTRGQDVGPGTASASLGLAGASGGDGDALPNSGLLGRSFRSLMDDLKSLLAKTPGLAPSQKMAVRSDFTAIALSSHRPDSASATALRQDLDAIVTDGRITNDGRAKIAQDLTALLNSAGVPPRLIDRTILDLAPVIRAADLAPADLKLLLGDLVNLLLARPKSVAGGAS